LSFRKGCTQQRSSKVKEIFYHNRGSGTQNTNKKTKQQNGIIVSKIPVNPQF